MVSRKRFDKVLKETIKDFEAASSFDFAEKLRFILNSKNIGKLRLTEVSPLIELISEDMPILSQTDYQINKEHKIMKKYIKQFFDFGVLDNGFIYISKKGVCHE